MTRLLVEPSRLPSLVLLGRTEAMYAYNRTRVWSSRTPPIDTTYLGTKPSEGLFHLVRVAQLMGKLDRLERITTSLVHSDGMDYPHPRHIVSMG